VWKNRKTGGLFGESALLAYGASRVAGVSLAGVSLAGVSLIDNKVG
jgi:hypothetical protein